MTLHFVIVVVVANKPEETFIASLGDGFNRESSLFLVLTAMDMVSLNLQIVVVVVSVVVN